jgi:hypothetical protein
VRCSQCKKTKTVHGLCYIDGKLHCATCIPKPKKKRKKKK